jgi:ATP-dependent Clp protease ATP-binding subunit ClpB
MLAARVQKALQINLEWDKKAVDYLVDEGYDPAFGARPLKRVIQQQVETLLSRKIVRGEVKPVDVVKVSANNEGLILEMSKPIIN